MKQQEFKEKMPVCAQLVDDLAIVFGKELIHGQVRRGIAGEPTFWARENGHEIGTRDTSTTVRVFPDPLTGVSIAEEIKRD